MKILMKNKIVIAGVLIIFLLIISGIGTAENLTIKEAIEIGLNNNKDIRNSRENIKALERELALIEAKQDWQVELGVNYNQTFADEDEQLINTEGVGKSAGLGISKSFSSGLTINPEFTVNDNNSDPGFAITINQQIYPSVPTELDKQYYKTQKQLLKVRHNYLQLKADKIISWLESYLTINRMYVKRDIYSESLEQAEENMKEVLAEQEIGEAGKQELLTARLSVKEAEYSLQDIDNKIEEAKMTLDYSTGLDWGEMIILTDGYQFIEQLKNKAEKLTGEYLSQSGLMAVVENNNYQIYVNRVDNEILKQELEWLKKEGKTDVNIIGSYDTEKDELTAGINLSYKFYDGGQQKIEYADKQSEIVSNEDDYNDIYNKLEIYLKQYKNEVELSEFQLEKAEIVLNRSKHEVETARKQYDMGLIDYLEYQEKWIEGREAEVSLRSLEDQLFIDRLKLIKFINIEDLTGGLF